MAKKKPESTMGEQLNLIEVTPENAKKIVGAARRYKTAQAERITALVIEKTEKQKLLQMVKDAKLQRLEDGTIRFKVDGLTIEVQPRDDLVKVKENGEENAE
jgi:hypothetical protein